MSRRPKTLPPEPGLQARMVLAVAAAAAALLGVLALAVWAAASGPAGAVVVAGVAILTLLGIAAGYDVARRERARPPRERLVREVAPEDVATVRSIVGRFAVMADVPMPAVDVRPAPASLSWTTAVPGAAPTIHITTGMLDELPTRELQAVIAHEMSHVLHRDAYVMTVLAGPHRAFWDGFVAASFLPGGETVFIWAAVGVGIAIAEDPSLWYVLLAVPVAAGIVAVTRTVSRHRELAADRGAAVLTGSPAAVASALLMVDRSLRGMPRSDLRAVAGRDDLHFVPAKPRARLLRAWATHPPTEDRIARLERLAA